LGNVSADFFGEIIHKEKTQMKQDNFGSVKEYQNGKRLHFWLTFVAHKRLCWGSWYFMKEMPQSLPKSDFRSLPGTCVTANQNGAIN